MMASLLDHLDRLAYEHPGKLLYSFLDLNGDSIESYTYASFQHRTKAIAAHLRNGAGFTRGERLLLAYPPGLEMICAFFGCVRAGLIPVPVYPPSSRGFQSALYKMVYIAKDCDAAGTTTPHSRQTSQEVESAGPASMWTTSPAFHGLRRKILWTGFRTRHLSSPRRFCSSNTHPAPRWSRRA